MNPALQVHLNSESSSCDTIQVPPFKQVESLQGSSAKGNIHAGVTTLRLNDCFISNFCACTAVTIAIVCVFRK